MAKQKNVTFSTTEELEKEVTEIADILNSNKITGVITKSKIIRIALEEWIEKQKRIQEILKEHLQLNKTAEQILKENGY